MRVLSSVQFSSSNSVILHCIVVLSVAVTTGGDTYLKDARTETRKTKEIDAYHVVKEKKIISRIRKLWTMSRGRSIGELAIFMKLYEKVKLITKWKFGNQIHNGFVIRNLF